MIITELIKSDLNRNLSPSIYYWRDSSGNEVDVIIEKAGKLLPLEIKAGQTVVSDYFKGFEHWKNIAGDRAGKMYLVYGGQRSQKRSQVEVLAWDKAAAVYKAGAHTHYQ